MTLLPIVQRELAVATRQRRTHWLRLGIPVASSLLVLWIWVGESLGQTSAPGLMLFRILAGIGFSFSLVAGLWATAQGFAGAGSA